MAERPDAWVLRVIGAVVPERRRRPLGRLLRFGTVGLIGFGVNEGLLYLGHGRAALPLWLAQVIAIESAIICNYLLNDRWTFHHPKPAFHRFVRFNGVSLVSLVVNFLVVQLCTHFTSLHYLAANALGVVLGFGVNYVLNVYWAYGKALSHQAPPEAALAGGDRRSVPVDLPADPA